MSEVESRLSAAGITLPVPVAPVANYVPFVRSGVLVHISGQVSLDASGGVKGVVGVDVGLEAAQGAARLCGINLLTQMINKLISQIYLVSITRKIRYKKS